MNTLEKAKKEIAEIINYNKAQREEFNKKKEEILHKIEDSKNEISNLQKELNEMELSTKSIDFNAILEEFRDVVYNEAKIKYGKLTKSKDSVSIITLLSESCSDNNAALLRNACRNIKEGYIEVVLKHMLYNSYLYKIPFHDLLSNIKNKYEVIEYEYEESITIKKEEVINNIPVVVYNRLDLEEIIDINNKIAIDSEKERFQIFRSLLQKNKLNDRKEDEY